MIISPAVLDAAYKSFNTKFNQGLGSAASQRGRVAMEAPSGARSNIYAWLQGLPGMREWVGDRVLHDLATKGYELTNKKYEESVAVKRDDIEDDQLGTYAPMFEMLGQDAALHPDQLVFALLNAGFTNEGPDGQYFFDSDHEVAGASVSNTGGGSGTAWFLLCTTRPVKPLIFQMRRTPKLTRKDQPNDENVFLRDENVYGVDYRGAAGFGLWQLAYGSKQTLDATAYNAAFAAMMSFKSESDNPLGIVPNLLVVPPSLRKAGQDVVEAQNLAGGASNTNYKTAELLVVPWLA